MKKKSILNLIAVILIAASLVYAIIHSYNNNYSQYYIARGGNDPSCPSIYIEDDGDRFYFGHNNKRIYISNFFNYFTDENGITHNYQSNVYSSGGLSGAQEALIIFAACTVVIGISYGIARFSITTADNTKKELEKLKNLSRGGKQQ